MTAVSIDDEANPVPTSERALRWIGDLDHPFYEDERNRFIWYEASAIAFQMFLLANLAIGGLMLWIGGSDALPYALAVLVVNAIVAMTGIQYAKQRYAEYTPKKTDFIRSRGVFSMFLALVVATGLVRALVFDGSAETNTSDSVTVSVGFSDVAGFVVGLAIPLVIVLVLTRRRNAKAEANREDVDEF